MRELSIATSNSRTGKKWQNKKYTWPQLLARLSETVRTPETVTEFHRMSKSEQAPKKDHGGFVGGYLSEGRRTSQSVTFRSVLCMDMDKASPNAWEVITAVLPDAELCIYSTHSHRPGSPRLRLILPLSADVTPDQYKAATRKLAELIGMEEFDPTTFQPERLMYWPSTPRDGEFLFRHQQGAHLDPQFLLSKYVNPGDISAWPLHPLESDHIVKSAKQQGDPKDKDGLIGAFCRAYNIHEAIEEFLSAQYEPTDKEDRYTFTGGTAAAGAVTYHDNFLFSHHSTDPASGLLCNAFDLVRLHKFGEMDDTSHRDTKPGSRPSFKKMMGFVRSLPEVTREAVTADFSNYVPEDNDEEVNEPANTDWLGLLTMNLRGEIEPTIPNFELIIDNDPRLKNRFYYDEFEDRTFVHLPLPWDKEKNRSRDLKDIDDSNLESFISKEYKVHHAANIKKAFDNVCYSYKVHPVREYLNKLVWDGLPRIEHVLTEYMGAEDTEYTRTVTRKSLIASVARIYSPGTKFDNIIILSGPEGIMKSSIIKALGGKWFSDTFVGIHGVDSMQQLQGTWLMEIPELAAFNKMDVEAIKAFLSKQIDKYRSSFGRRNGIHPRQTIFWGTTNRKNPLKGDTGNRRFWVVYVQGVPWEKYTQLNVDQVWAEAVHYYRKGEELELPVHIRIEAKAIQQNSTEKDERSGLIQNYLEMLLPEDWAQQNRQERQNYINRSSDDLIGQGTIRRDRVCAAEIWCEILGGKVDNMTSHNTKPIHEAMAMMEGWEQSKNPLNFSIYGRQKAYIRISGSEHVKTIEPVKQEEIY